MSKAVKARLERYLENESALNNKLKDEISRLREELNGIAEYCHWSDDEEVNRIGRMARRALEGQG